MIWVLLQSESPWQRNDAITLRIPLKKSSRATLRYVQYQSCEYLDLLAKLRLLVVVSVVASLGVWWKQSVTSLCR